MFFRCPPFVEKCIEPKFGFKFWEFPLLKYLTVKLLLNCLFNWFQIYLNASMRRIIRFPFNSKNPIGFLFALAIQYIMLLNIFYFGSCLMCTGIGCYLFGSLLANDIKGYLYSINQSIKDGRHSIQIFKQLSKFFRFHSDTKQLSSNTQNKKGENYARVVLWTIRN